jgi:lactate dehydrogenase-like 2-hydroxyacid dehydrogenase
MERTGNAEVVLISPWGKLTASYFKSCPSVKYIGIGGTSTANIDLQAAKQHNVTVTNIVGHGDEPAAEFIFMQLLMLARGFGKCQWKNAPCELMNKTIGIIGLGNLGKAVAHLALGFKMNTLYHSKTRKSELEKHGIQFSSLNNLLKNSDVVVVCTPTNLKIMNQEQFDHMKPNSVLIQMSVGEILDQKAFKQWLSKDNNYALFNYAAGDEYYQAFKDLPNVVFADTVAGFTKETKERLGQGLIDNLLAYKKAI